MPGRQRHEWLDGEIEFRTEASANRCWDNSHLLGWDPQYRREVAAVHVRRLCGGLNFDGVADAASEPCFRLDVGVLDKARFALAGGGDLGVLQCFLDIAAYNT